MHAQKTLLIVDDQPGVRRLLYEIFKGDFCIEEAASGAEALEKLQRITPSLVLLDMNMPGLSGLQTLEKIRDMDIEVPVVMVTASGETENVKKAEQLGVKDYLCKPFDIEKVRRLAKEYIK
ncbi:response regulator [Desulfofalx alkaliphila]|uniref:response regulator n=1 Tax=Desulfofalx alkaliphila TaxID=105483 RepID=UPI0004E219A0|nr:response regulator [Desulfofalx alkaliphila]